MRRGYATQRATARPSSSVIQPTAKASASKASAKSTTTTSQKGSLTKDKTKTKPNAKSPREPVYVEIEKAPRFKLKDVFPAKTLEWAKTASYKDMMRKFREAHQKVPEFKPRQAIVEALLQKAETKAQLRRTVDFYLKNILHHDYVKQQAPRQRLTDLIFKRFVEMGDNRYAMHLLRDPTYRIWPSPRLLQKAMLQWTFKDGKARTTKAIAGVWSLFTDKADLSATPTMLSSGLRALLQGQDTTKAVPVVMNIAHRHSKTLTADHYILSYRAAIQAKDNAALQSLIHIREKHIPEAQVMSNAGFLKLEIEARLNLNSDEQLKAAVKLFDALPDDARVRLVRSLLVDAALTPGLASRLSALWQASSVRNSPSDVLKPLAELLTKLDGNTDPSPSLRSSPLLQEQLARIDAQHAKRSSKKTQKPAASAEAEAPVPAAQAQA